MRIEDFQRLVARLERESAERPRLYQAKVAALALLGFGILGLLLGAVGLGLLLIVGLVAAVAFSGGAALLLVLKFAKVLWVLLIPLWFLVRDSVRALFVRLPAPQGRTLQPAEAPALFDAIEHMRRQMGGPRVHQVLLVDEVNAAIVQRPALGLVGWPRNHLLLGLPLLESLPPEEALAVVAHEYGHLAGSHGRFAAFIYRLRHTWSVLEAFAAHIQSWVGRLVAPLVRWYAPYFNAYTFVLARANEYQADRASAELVGAAPAAQALKRVNLVAPRHRRFLQQTFDRIDHDAQPPADLMQRWAAQAAQAPAEAEARRWLDDALDRVSDPTDSHPTLRARLAALQAPAQADSAARLPPPPRSGPSAAEAWLGPVLDRLRQEFQSHWASAVADPWAERHGEVQKLRQRLASLREQAEPDRDTQLEIFRLAQRLEPALDQREALSAFNRQHPELPLGLFLEACARLRQGEAAGLALLERAIALDAEATGPACERAWEFLAERGEVGAAEAWAVRWRERQQLEALREVQLQTLDPDHPLLPHGLDPDTLAALRSRLTGHNRRHLGRVYLARRQIPADPNTQQLLLALELSLWGRLLGQREPVLQRLAATEWPQPLMIAVLDGRLKPMRTRLDALAGARLR